jgi:hypothetical protein
MWIKVERDGPELNSYNVLNQIIAAIACFKSSKLMSVNSHKKQ